MAATRATASTDASRALQTADLLTRALALRDATRLADDCPVCRSTGVLDEAWAADAHIEAERLRTQASELQSAQRAQAAAAGAWSALTDRLAEIAGEIIGTDLELDEAHCARRPRPHDGVKRADTARGAGHGVAGAPRGDDGVARRCGARPRSRLRALKTLKVAEKWLKDEADALRNERFAPIADQAIANWDLLKHESNVELRDITLRTVGRRREASFDVRADGEKANAIGVMSQGELLALSVSVFLPRAGLDESPFRFAVIDDPVQSMDPAKVDGLANVLARSASTRQVVVFTHDDRLPEAVRRLKLNATVLQVHRRSRSQVAVHESLTPMRRHLDNAKLMARSQRVTEEVRRRVVPSLCREAVEAACSEIVRGKAVARGESASSVDERLRATRNLRSLLALALLDDPDDHAALNPELQRLGSGVPSLVAALNAGAHGGFVGSAVDDARAHKRPRRRTDAVGMNVVEMLRAALALLDDPVEDTATVWPLGAAVLIRQAIEATIDAFWAKTVPDDAVRERNGAVACACRPISGDYPTSKRPSTPGRRCPRPATTASTTSGLPSPSCGRICERQMRSAGRSVRSLRRAPGCSACPVASHGDPGAAFGDGGSLSVNDVVPSVATGAVARAARNPDRRSKRDPAWAAAVVAESDRARRCR